MAELHDGRRAAAVSDFGLADSATDALALLAWFRPEGVIVVTPLSAHDGLARAALALDIPELVEKPVVADAAGMEQLCAADAASRTFLQPGHFLRFSTPHRALRDILMSGEIGSLIAFSSRRYTAFGLPKDRHDLRLSVSACLHSKSPRSSCRENSTHAALTFGGDYRPAGTNVFLGPLRGLVSPIPGHLARFDRRVFRAGIVVARHRHDRRVQNLPAPRNIALSRQIPVELPEKRIDHPRLRQSFPVQPDRHGVRHPVPETKVQKPHERKPVTDLILDLIVRQVVKRAQNQRLEHQNHNHRLAPGAGFPRLGWLAPDPLQYRPELLPWHDGAYLDQRVLLRIQARVTIRKIKETHLRHDLQPPSHHRQISTPPSEQGQLLKVPLRNALNLFKQTEPPLSAVDAVDSWKFF